jgi:hypothetical protein
MGDDRGNGRVGLARPGQVTVRALDEGVQVAWERPEVSVCITSYDLTPCLHSAPLPQKTVTVDGSSTSGLVRGLINGETYTVRITPWHDEVPGPSAVSPSFQPNAPPDAPTRVAAVAGEQSATVSWEAPQRGGPVDEYRVAAAPAHGGTVVVPAAQTSALVPGLRNGRRYTFTVAAVNGAGESVSGPSNPVWSGDDVPAYLFPLELAYLLLLGAIAYVYAIHYQPFAVSLGPLGSVTVPTLRDAIPATVAGVPVSIPWFGAAGAVLIGLYGIFDHGHRDWQRRLNAWHIARPFTGALLGAVAYIAFVGVVRATGVTLTTADPVGRLIYFMIAFVVGFREQTFRRLLARGADLILGPGAGQDVEGTPRR